MVVLCVVLAITGPALAELRTWTDSSGKHSTEAELISVEDGSVKLRRTNGKELTVAIEKLSTADQDFIDAYLTSPDESPVKRQPTPEADEARRRDQKKDIAAVTVVAKDFFSDLRTKERDAARALLTAEAQTLNTATTSPLGKLPQPDPGSRSIKVSRQKLKTKPPMHR